MRAYQRLLKYVVVHTTSDEESESCPSTKRQLDLGNILCEEMKSIGLTNVNMDKNGYVFGTIPATKGCENSKIIGLISHMDTAPAFSGENVKPRIIENYDGGDILLNEDLGITMATKVFPHLLDYVGKDLIVTDGTTLLGGDDKAGIAEIMTLADELINGSFKDIRHGKIRVAFTPDEEIGRGADLFDVEAFGADYAYTVDGGKLGEIEYENFNAASAKVHVQGENIHPGEAKDKMKNSLLVAMEFNSMLPPFETPAHTENYEGFYHLCDMSGNEENTNMAYIIRDHSGEKFEARKAAMVRIADYLNEKYGTGTIKLELKDSYYNMKEKLEPAMYIVDKAVEAMKKCGITPVIVPIRGGTDGARLSFMGLLCPNLCTGGHNFHGKYEYICIQSMDSMVDVLKNIVEV